MLCPKKVIDIELSQPIHPIENLDGYFGVFCLVRLHGAPVGYVDLPVINGRCPANIIREKIIENLGDAVLKKGIYHSLAAGLSSNELHLETLLDTLSSFSGPFPLVSVAVCTRDRTDDLAMCLEALTRLDYPNLEFLVIDNAPTNQATKQLVAGCYPTVRYICEPRPGLDWARNRAILEAQGEIIAYTDDDVIVDPGWVTALAQSFVECPVVMAVTGLVAPYELETEAQNLFELYGGFGRGFKQRWVKIDATTRSRWQFFGAGQYGTGANMAYRRSVFDEIGLFDPALDVGTVTNGGGDLEMFFRIIKEGYVLLYQPDAVVWHRHRRELNELKTQLANNSIGLYAYFVRSAQYYPEERFQLIYLGVWWFLWWYVRRVLLSFMAPQMLPKSLIWSELRAVPIGLRRYKQAQQNVADIEKVFGPHPQPSAGAPPESARIPPKNPHAVAVRSVDLQQPLKAITNLTEYSSAKILVNVFYGPIGFVDIDLFGDSISRNRLIKSIADFFGGELLQKSQIHLPITVANETTMTLIKQMLGAAPTVKTWERLPDDVVVSVVLATLDRPDDLRNCLKHLRQLNTTRHVEIVVVDNNPESGQTAPVIAEFPGIVLVKESRRGLAYARNAGFIAAAGQIVIATDDDVTAPPDWLEKLIAPFSRPDVMAVTGNVLPIELESMAQHMFEQYGGLGRGFKAWEADEKWFFASNLYAAHTWELGATANAAFRATIFNHPEIGLMDEALGPGMPSGVGEDTYLFYKILKAGLTLVYEPSAYVWHKHRSTDAALRKQLFNYSKGHVAYHLTTLLRDKDLRAIFHLFVPLVLWRIKQILLYIKDVITGDVFWDKTRYPLSLILLEIYGNLLGPLALWQSRQRVKREGRSNRQQ